MRHRLAIPIAASKARTRVNRETPDDDREVPKTGALVCAQGCGNRTSGIERSAGKDGATHGFGSHGLEGK